MSDTPLADALKDYYCFSHLDWYYLCCEVERENAALRADKERLDWLLTDDGGFWVNWMYDKDEWTPELKASRDAIDACRNGRIGREKP